jgi:hypothetical protein
MLRQLARGLTPRAARADTQDRPKGFDALRVSAPPAAAPAVASHRNCVWATASSAVQSISELRKSLGSGSCCQAPNESLR